MSEESDALAPGTAIGPYVIEGVLGASAMATVYLARSVAEGGARRLEIGDEGVVAPSRLSQKKLELGKTPHVGPGSLVALKALHRQFAVVPTYVQRFAQEARAASALHHRHVIEVLDVRTDAERPYLVMEYLPGETLADRLMRARRLPVDVLAATILPVVSAVSAAHAAGIIHRDLKPDNIILAREEGGGERPVLLDFGISKMLEGRRNTALTQAGQVVGTPYYMSPEQIRSEELDGRSDLYSLGVLLYECVTGVRPFRAEQSVYVLMAEILLGQPVPPSQVEPSVPATFEAVILRAMALRREDRFASAEALGRALLPFAGAEACAKWARAFGADPDDIVPMSAPPPVEERVSFTPPPVAGRAMLVDPSLVTQPANPAFVPRSGDEVTREDLLVLSGMSELAPAELDAFCMAARARKVGKDEVLFSQGATGDVCFVILRGAVELSKVLDGTGMVLDVLGPGTFVGQDALVDRATRSVTARAARETLVVELTRDELHRRLGFHDRVALRLLELIAVTGIRQLRGGTRKLAALLEARGLGQEPESAEITGTRPLEQLRVAVREWSVRIDER